MTDSDTPSHSPPTNADWLLRAADAHAEFGGHTLAAEIRIVAERMKQRGSSEDLFPPSRQVIDQLQVTESVWTDPAVVAAIDATIAVYPPPDLVSESDGAKDEQGGGRDTEPDPTI